MPDPTPLPPRRPRTRAAGERARRPHKIEVHIWLSDAEVVHVRQLADVTGLSLAQVARAGMCDIEIPAPPATVREVVVPDPALAKEVRRIGSNVHQILREIWALRQRGSLGVSQSATIEAGWLEVMRSIVALERESVRRGSAAGRGAA